MSAEHSVQSDWEDIYNLIKDMNILFSFLLHTVEAYKKISLWTFAGFFSDTPSSFVAISSHSVRRSILTRPNTSLSNRRYSNHTITISFQPTEYMVGGRRWSYTWYCKTFYRCQATPTYHESHIAKNPVDTTIQCKLVSLKMPHHRSANLH